MASEERPWAVDPTKWDAPYPVIVCALFIIVFARANATYWLGRILSVGGSRSRLGYLLQRPSYLRAKDWLSSWGAPAVSASFLTIGVQTMVNLAAGVARMPLRRYLIAVILGSIAWALIYAAVGFVGITAFTKLWERSPQLAIALPLALAAGIGTTIALRCRRQVLPLPIDR